MTHEQAIDIVLEQAILQPKTDSLVEDAKRHITTCRQCWTSLGEVHELLFDESLPELTQAQRLLACREIRPRLWEVADVPEERLETADSAIGTHVKDCSECREELTALREALEYDGITVPPEPRPRSPMESFPIDLSVSVSQTQVFAPRGVIQETSAAAASSEHPISGIWRTAGKQIFELPSALVIAIHAGLVSLLQPPVGVSVEAFAWEPQRSRSLRARGIEVEVPDRLLFVVELTESCHLPLDESLRVSLTQQSSADYHPLGGDTISAQKTRVEFPELTSGKYALELLLKRKSNDVTVQIPLLLKQQEPVLKERNRTVQVTVTLPETDYTVRLKWTATNPPPAEISQG
ncbi:MAG: hypothetical protein HYZ50_20050 [Deltaproteobacteria bacterium]|nr:hypothetical protein [Deltaproteobacteria bacterium]